MDEDGRNEHRQKITEGKTTFSLGDAAHIHLYVRKKRLAVSAKKSFVKCPRCKRLKSRFGKKHGLRVWQKTNRLTAESAIENEAVLIAQTPA